MGFLKDFADEFKSESDSKKQSLLSPDGTVHEVTSTTMNTLKKIFEYRESLSIVIEESKDMMVSLQAKGTVQYINQVIDSLLQDIEAKAKTYKKPVLSCLFTLNNAHYISKTVKGHSITDAETQEKIDKTIKKQLDAYRTRFGF